MADAPPIVDNRVQTLSGYRNSTGANNPQFQGAAQYNRTRIKPEAKKNQLLMALLQMMIEDEEPEDKATETYQEELAGDKDSTLTPALANNPATALMGPQKPKEEPKDNFKNMLLALLLKSQG